SPSWRMSSPWRSAPLAERGSDLPRSGEPVCHLPPSRERPASRGQARKQGPSRREGPGCGDRGGQGGRSTLAAARPTRLGSTEGRSARVGAVAATSRQNPVTAPVTTTPTRQLTARPHEYFERDPKLTGLNILCA